MEREKGSFPPRLSVEIAGIRMKNPVMVASGTFGFGEEYASFLDLSLLGAIVTKTITLQPRQGNPPPRIWETPCGMLNSIGLQNPGVEVFLKEKLPFLKDLNTPVIVSIGGENKEEFVALGKRLEGVEGISGLELNLSCPNLKRGKGELLFSQDPVMVGEVVGEVKKVSSFPLLIKLSPQVTDIVPPAKAAVESGADALSLINTFPGLAIDIETRRPWLGNITGGLSGPAIRPLALFMVRKVVREVKVPIVAMGGISSASDALEFLIAGANAVAIGMANFIDPQTPVKVVEGIKEYLEKKGIGEIGELVNSLITD